MLALLAPVPAKILADGLIVKNADGLVAFGTGAITEVSSGAWSFEFFSKPEIAQGKGELPILIYGSSTDLHGDHSLHRPGYVTAIATYQGIRNGKAGKHPRPEFRPQAALKADWDYPMFWEVSNLRALTHENHIPLKRLMLPGTGKLRPHSGVQPRGPQLVWLPNDLTEVLYKKS